MLAGAAWLDYDDDGFLDLYLLQGHADLEHALERRGSGPGSVLLRNVGGRRFEDVTEKSGARDLGYGMGAATGDYDGDGHVDLLVTSYGLNTLYRNRGDGTFEDATERSGLGGGRGTETGEWSTSATWADYDGDGLLDLYVVNYLAYRSGRDGACESTAPGSGRKVAAYCHPHRFEGAPDRLFRNLGGGKFRDASVESGIARSRGWQEAKGLGVVASDFDLDGDVDFLVANDSVANTLWHNQGAGRFEDTALALGFALNGDAETEACMGICRSDVDSDGDLDYWVTNFSRETNTLYLNGGGFFEDATAAFGLARPTYLPLGFGTAFLDFDLDGDEDLYVANGHILDNAEELHPGEAITYAQADLLLANALAERGTVSFTDVSKDSGAWFKRRLVGRAVAAADYDNDGDTDLLVTHVAGPAVLLENQAIAAGVSAEARRSWIGIDLRAAPGAGVVHNAWVEVDSGGRRRVREVQTDGSYLAAHDPRVVVALARGEAKARVRVRWVGRRDFEDFGELQAGKYHRLSRTAR
jgi:hypothetical protein